MATYENWLINVLAGRKSRFGLDEATSGVAWTTRNGSFPIVIKYIGSLAVANVEVATGVIEFNHGATYAAEAVDTDTKLDADGVGLVDTTAGAWDTYGELVDWINGSDNWRAYLLDGYRSQTCALKDLTVANDNTSLASQTSGVGLLQNCSGASDVMWVGLRNISLRAAFPESAVNAGTIDTGFSQLLYGCQLSINATGSPVFQIIDYHEDGANSSSDVLYQPAVLTDNTATPFNFSDLMDAPLIVVPGHRILVGVTISTIVTQSYIAVQGSVFKA